MMTHEQARQAFMTLIDSFDYLDQSLIFTQNQKMGNDQPFEPPEHGLWCEVSIQNAPSFIASIGNKPCTRTVGNLIIQCFERLNNDTVELTKLADAWIEHLQFKQISHLEILQGSVINVGRVGDFLQGKSGDFYQFNVIFEYRIN